MTEPVVQPAPRPAGEPAMLRQLRRRWLATLVVVVGVAALGQFLVQRELNIQAHDAEGMRLLARQRMYYERAARAALATLGATDPATRTARAADLEQALTRWEQDWQLLARDRPGASLAWNVTPTLREQLLEAARVRDLAVHAAGTFLAQVRAAADNPLDRTAAEVCLAPFESQAARFETLMIDLGNRYQADAEQRIHTLRIIQLGLLLLQCGAVVAGWLVVFEPSVRAVRRQVEHLADSETRTRHLLETVFRPAAETVHYQLTQLRDSEAKARRLALVASKTTNGVIITDAAGLIEWVNDGFTRLTEYTLEDVRGKTPGSLLHGAQTDPLAVLHMRQAMNRCEGFKLEILNYAKSGRTFWNMVQVEPIRDEVGRLTNWIGIESDITERKQAEAALLASERRFRALIEHATDMTGIFDEAGVMQYISPSVQPVLGYTTLEVVGKAVWDFIHPDDLASSRQVMLNALRSPGLPQVNPECRVRHRSGRWLYVESVTTNLLNDPNIRGLVINARDITTRREAEENYRSIFENAVEGIFQSTLSGRYLSVNPALARLYGYDSPAELMHRVQNIAVQVYADPERRRAFIAALETQDVVTDFQSEVRRKDGSTLWISESARAVRDADGALRYFEGSVIDITARRHAEESLAGERNFIAAVLDLLTALVAVVDRDGRIIRFNHACERLTGYKASEVIGRPFQDFLLTPEERPAVGAVLAALVHGKYPNEHTNDWVGRDGRRHLIHWTNTAMSGPDGQVTYVIASGVDLTEQEQTRRRLLEQQALLHAALDAQPAPMAILDPQGTVLVANEAWTAQAVGGAGPAGWLAPLGASQFAGPAGQPNPVAHALRDRAPDAAADLDLPLPAGPAGAPGGRLRVLRLHVNGLDRLLIAVAP